MSGEAETIRDAGIAVPTLKLPRTIRLDPSDTFVFRNPATPGEWAVTGSFLFAETQPDALDAKARAAFRSGFLGVGSFGWSTLVVVTEASEAECEAAIVQLAAYFTSNLGAPDMGTALAAAREEIMFAASLCDHAPQTLLALNRGMENGEMRERFRTLTPRAGRPKAGLTEGFRAFEFIESEGDADDDEIDQPLQIEEHVDLLALGKIAALKGHTS